jgi:hypothetical protein
MAINNLLASPGFATWMKGEPLDAQRLLYTPEGKPRLSIISIGHLSDTERMFIVTLVLNEVISWMRNQSGTSSLRAILYMDEIFGYFPPTANPPSKIPMLTLLKQARAFGLGCVLATQNPVDLDYKGLANCGTWLIGRLQTERDKARVIEGLESALAGTGSMDRSTLDKLMSALTQRVFLMRNVHQDAPYLMKSRWALSFLRGPLTGPEITRVMAGKRGAAAPASTPTAAPSAAPAATSAAAPVTARPAIPGDVTEYFLEGRSGQPAAEYRPMVMGLAKLHFVDAKLGLDQWDTAAWLAPLGDDGKSVDWAAGSAHPDLKARLSKSPATGAAFADLPGAAMRAANYAAWGKTLTSHLYEQARAEVFFCDAIKLASAPGEDEAQFRMRLAQSLREKRDEAVEALRRKVAPKLATLQDRVARAEDKVQREQAQLSQQKMNTAVSVGAGILGALFGRKAVSVGTIGRASSAARSASRISRESQDVARADESLEVVRQRLADLQAESEAEIAALAASFEGEAVALRKVSVTPRKSDIAVGQLALVWVPWRKDADGFPVVDA